MDNDELDGCEIDMSSECLTDEEVDLVVLNPDNDPEVTEAYKKLFPEGS